MSVVIFILCMLGFAGLLYEIMKAIRPWRLRAPEKIRSMVASGTDYYQFLYLLLIGNCLLAAASIAMLRQLVVPLAAGLVAGAIIGGILVGLARLRWKRENEYE